MQALIIAPNPWMILPFVLLLAAIAMGPFLFPKWWLRHYPKVALSLAAITLSYYIFWLKAGSRLLEGAHDYISFIVLIGSLFVVAGGIHINVKGEATPAANAMFLFIGAILANVLGTTGAAMLLIRPWIRMNKYRITAHHIVFFIFIVANVGGCLTPIGDPPLFLGYLKGIPFWWVAEHCWQFWAIGIGYLVMVFYAIDQINYRRAPVAVRHELTGQVEQWRFEGKGNVVFLAVILAAVFIQRPIFLREVVMAAAALASWSTTRKSIHEANHFDFHPIREVAILFLGIFSTMVPALDWLEINATQVVRPTAGFFFWGTGVLSSFLDNAPTYLSFLSASLGMFVDPQIVGQVEAIQQAQGLGLPLSGAAPELANTVAALQTYFAPALAQGHLAREQIEVAYLLGNLQLNKIVVAISVGAVFFGANTYIGNGPNFMIKAIADHQKVHTPGFFGFILKYALPCMLPLLLLLWWLFFRAG